MKKNVVVSICSIICFILTILLISYISKTSKNDINNSSINTYKNEVETLKNKENVEEEKIDEEDKIVDDSLNNEQVNNNENKNEDDNKSVTETSKKTKNQKKKYIAFTFDDGPGDYTIDLVNYLESTNSSATFFMLGNRMKSRTKMVEAVYNSNSEVGSHSYSHKNMTKLSDEKIVEELNKTNKVYKKITDDNIKLFRPPYGSYKSNLLDKGYIVVTWNVDTKDWKYRDKDKVYKHIIKHACDGCIVLMHEIYKPTLEAVKMVIPKLQEDNYEIVSVSKLMEIKNYKYNKSKVISYIK